MHICCSLRIAFKLSYSIYHAVQLSCCLTYELAQSDQFDALGSLRGANHALRVEYYGDSLLMYAECSAGVGQN